MNGLFNILLVQPFFNALIFIYNALPWADIGLATIILTIIIRVILFPLFHKSAKQQMMMSQLQPKLAKIQKEYKDNKEQLVKAQMALYKENNMSPFGGCLVTLIQLPILLAVYRVFLNGFSSERMADLYNFVARPEMVNTIFLGWFDLSKPNIYLAVVSAILQFISSKMIVVPMPAVDKNEKVDSMQNISSSLQKNMTFIAPAMTFIVLVSLPSILGIYWSITTIFSIIQQWIVNRKLGIGLKNKMLSS